jgi:hypothetical protein
MYAFHSNGKTVFARGEWTPCTCEQAVITRFEERPQERVRLSWGCGHGGPDIKPGAKRAGDDRAARAVAKAVADRWNEQLAAGRDCCGRR